jgi:hypothetical protein
MNEDVIENMRSRLERFRRLSTMITDKRAIDVLQQMALEAEEDIKRLQARSGKAEPGS